MNYHNIFSDLWSALLLPSGVALTTFYLLYKILVRNDAHLNSRRFAILGFLIFALALPLLNFQMPVNTAANEPGTFYQNMALISKRTHIWLEPIIITSLETHSILNIIEWIYVIGVLFLMGRGFVGILRLAVFSKNGKRLPTKNATIMLGTNISTAFSFFNRIFIPEKWYNNEGYDFVLRHEQVHVKQKHSWDLMLMEIICIVQFFNPFVWLLKREMRLNHEFLADRGALENGGDKHQYFQLLTQKTIGKQPILVHSLNYSPLKYRIMMQISKPAKPLSQARYLAFVPLALALTFLFACQEKSTSSEDINFQKTTDEELLIIVDGNEFQGSLKNVDSTFTNNILSCTVLKDSTAVAQYGQRGANGVIIITTKSGEIKKQQGISEMTNENKGNPADLENQIFQVVEINPSYPGGEEARHKYLAENIKYPQEAREKNIQGTVYTSFVVERDGRISNVQIVRGIGGGCDEEILRIVKNMPKWTPGKQRGQTVRVQFMMPIKFTLPEDDKKKS